MNEAAWLRAVTYEDVTALGWAQTRGEDIRPPHERPAPVDEAYEDVAAMAERLAAARGFRD